jgi:hypothetical protein
MLMRSDDFLSVGNGLGASEDRFNELKGAAEFRLGACSTKMIRNIDKNDSEYRQLMLRMYI